MRLLIKQKVFSWRDRFYIKDENGNDRYYAEGEIFTWGKKLHVYDLAGSEAAYIEQQVFSWLPKYHIYRNGTPAAVIKKEFTFLRPKYTLHGVDWKVEGSFWQHDYSILSGGNEIGRVNKQWFTWGDFYVLDIKDGWDEVLALSVVLIIDCVMAAEAAASAAT